jgi:hypothetical protein
MSTSEQKQQQPDIICVEHEHDDQYGKSTNQSPIDLEKQPKLPVSCKSWDNTYTAYHISEKFVVIEITETNTLVKIEYPWRSKPLHVHIIEDLLPVYDIDGNNFNEVFGHIIFVIFHDHILRIHLENQTFIHLEDRKLGSLFKECKTDFSFRISEPESSSFRIIEDERNERLRACLVLDETSWKKVELFEINLFRDDECLFTKSRENFFRLPPNITGIEINLEDDYIILSLTGKSTEFPIYIYDEKTDALDDYYASPIFLLNECERCILATSDQLDRFQMIGFEIVGTMYVCPFKDDDDFPEIQEFIKIMLEELNKYHRCRWDSDCGSDSD